MCTVILYNELGYSSLNSIQCTSFKNKRNTGNKRIRRDTFWTVLLHFIHLKMLEPVPVVSFANFWGLLATVHFEIQLDFIDRKIVWWRQQNCRWRNKFQLKNWKLRSDQYDIAERNTVLCDFAISSDFHRATKPKCKVQYQILIGKSWLWSTFKCAWNLSTAIFLI